MSGKGIMITRNESIFFLLSFFLLFSYNTSPVVLYLAIALTLLFFLKRKEAYFFWSILAPRINGDAPILTYLLSLAREEGPGKKELPDLMVLRIPFIPPIFFMFKTSYIKRILSLEAENFPSGGDTGPMVKITGGSGKNILLSSGPPNPHWARYRELSSSLNKDRFGSSSTVGEMFRMTWQTTQELSVKHFQAKLGKPLDLFYEIYHVMIPAHNRALFGEEFQKKFTYSKLSHDMYDIITETGKQLKFDFCPPHLRGKYMGQLKSVADAIKNMMRESTSPLMKPLSDALKEGRWTEEELFANVMVFEYAQAPLHVAFWLLYALSLHPEEEKKVVSEISNLLAEGPMTYERLPEFRYLTKVLSETLRLYPGVGLMQVRSSKYNTQFGEHFVPEGAYVFLCNFLIQRNATYWSNPDEFIPDRDGIDPAQYDIPFGNGPRQCQGQYFAQDFVKVTVISILQHYKLVLSPGQKEAEPTEIGFLRPARPIYFQLEKRVLPTPQPTLLSELATSRSAATSSSTLSRPASPVSVTFSRPSIPPSPFTNESRTSSPYLNFHPSAGSGSSASSSSLRKLPPKRYSRSSKAIALASQSQIFKDTYVSNGRIKTSHDLLVLYGSQTGNARNLATRVVHMAGLCKLSSSLIVTLDVKRVADYKAVVIITSTYGDGGAPENAEKFENWLEKETSTDIFENIPYAVLSLGSSLYPFPFKFGTFLARRFEQLGAKRIIPDERIDEIKYNQSEVFTKWSARLFEEIVEKTKGVDESSKGLLAKNKMLGFQNFDFNVLQPTFQLSFTSRSLKKENRIHYPNNVVFARVANNELANSEPSNQIYSLEMSFTVGELSFLAGDNVVVYPSNPDDMVGRLIERLGFEKNRVFNIIETQDIATTGLSCSLGNNKCTLEIALSHFYDITSPPSSSMLKFLAMHSCDGQDQKTLLSYSNNYRSFLKFDYTILDLLENTSSISLDGEKREENLAVFLELLGPIKQRHYSVSNFPGSSYNTVRIVFKVVSYTTQYETEKFGLCSNYLKSKEKGDKIPIAIMKARRFRLPVFNSTPIIMAGAGSGISPYFGFVEQRLHHKKNGEQLGEAVIIHGCRSEADFACKEKIDAALEAGGLSELWPAYSRKHGSRSVRVQDIFAQKGEEIWKLLEQGGVVYTCGDISVNLSIRDALVKLAQVYGKLGAFQAHKWLDQLFKEGRLRNDEWGIATTSGESTIRAARLKMWRKSILAILASTKRSPKTKPVVSNNDVVI